MRCQRLRLTVTVFERAAQQVRRCITVHWRCCCINAESGTQCAGQDGGNQEVFSYRVPFVIAVSYFAKMYFRCRADTGKQMHLTLIQYRLQTRSLPAVCAEHRCLHARKL
jgi:hypothetical protein